MWFRRKTKTKIFATGRQMQLLTEQIESQNKDIEKLRQYKELLCPYIQYGIPSLLEEAINEKISRIQSKKMELELQFE